MSLMLQVAMEDALHRRSGAYGHEYRGQDCTVVGRYFAGARLGKRILMSEYEFHECKDSKFFDKVFKVLKVLNVVKVVKDLKVF